MRRRVLLLLLMGGCALMGHGEPSSWVLADPPESTDGSAPRGVRLRPKAPVGEWHDTAGFASEGKCYKARGKRIRTAIARAREQFGDDARHDPALRRAVHSRCVPRDQLRARRE